jgi:hypothetical protein
VRRIGGDLFDAGRHLGWGRAGGLDLTRLLAGTSRDAVDDLAELGHGRGGLLVDLLVSWAPIAMFWTARVDEAA